MHANDLPVYTVYTVQIVVKYSPSSLRCKRINGSYTKTSDLIIEDSVLLKVFSGLPKVILKVLKDHSEMTGLCGPRSRILSVCV